MVNPLNDTHVRRLRRSMEQSRKLMEPYLRNRNDAVKQYVGKHYSDNGSPTRVPVNLLALLVNVLIRNLGARAPKTFVRPRRGYKELAPAAWDFEIALNATLKRVAFGKSLRLCILDALFSNGFVKIALHEEGSAEIGDMRFQGFHPFADPVSLDDFVIDLEKKRWDQAGFIGDRYALDYEQVMESRLFDKRAKQGLLPSDATHIDEQTGLERTRAVGADKPVGEEPYRDQLEVWDVWLPGPKLIVTMTLDDERAPLLIREWNGPDRGPYRHLGYIDVPDAILKSSPVALLTDLHALANEMYNKARDQGMDQKDILGVMPEAADDAQAIIDAGDRDVVKIAHPDKIKDFHFPGVDQYTLAFALEVMQRFSYFAGNLDVLGGLGVQADTATQEQMISSSASAQIQDMQAITADFVRDCCEDIGHLLWHDPLIELPLSRRPRGFEKLGVEQQFTWSPEHRVGEFLRYNIEINPHSLRDKTPQQQLNTVMTFLNQVFAPNAMFAMQQGVGLNFEGMARLWARLADMDEIEEILTFEGPPMAERKGPVGSPLPKPAVTKRTYERINRPGITAPGQHQIMMQMLLGSQLQPGQRAAMGRAVG